MSLVAVAATMIASQAVITGAFSVTRQAVQLGFLPPLRIRQVGNRKGRSTVPAVNWLLYIARGALVIGFGSAANLASAYGIAVTGTFATTTVLFFRRRANALEKARCGSAAGRGGLYHRLTSRSSSGEH